MIDLHNHLLPDVDDGARDADEARSALQSLQAHGVHSLVVTPHLRASLSHALEQWQARLERLDRAWEELRSIADQATPGLSLQRGSELMLDIPDPDLSDVRVRLAGTAFVLVEFPGMSIPPHSPAVLGRLVEQGWIPVLAHPERYAELADRITLVQEWKEKGCCLQMNAGSLLGGYGGRVRQLAWRLLEQGHIDYLASDYHARAQPALETARTELERRGATEQIRLLEETNPARLLAGERPQDVPPLPPRPSIAHRLAAWVRRATP